MAVLFTLLLGASALLLGYTLLDFKRQNLVRETEAAIDGDMARILSVVTDRNHEFITAFIDELSLHNTHPIYLYRSVDGAILSGNISVLPDYVRRLKEGIVEFPLVLDGKKSTVAAKVHTFHDGSTLLIARDISAIVESHNTLTFITILIIFFMLIVVLVSFIISIFVVKQINTIANSARHIIETGDLSERIHIKSRWDDLSNLAHLLNAMVAQTETLMQGVRDVSNNIAHDLRTPLARLRNHLEAGRNRPLTSDETEQLIEEADHLLGMFQSLLRIANMESGAHERTFANVDIIEVLQAVIELYEPLAEDKNILITQHINQIPDISGDKDLLFQLFANVVDNAIKYGAHNSVIEISVKTVDKRPTIMVKDQGIGIEEKDISRVFERFYRADESRNTEGTGLGLSLVKAIAELHGGDVSLAANNPGLRVIIRL